MEKRRGDDIGKGIKRIGKEREARKGRRKVREEWEKEVEHWDHSSSGKLLLSLGPSSMHMDKLKTVS